VDSNALAMPTSAINSVASLPMMCAPSSSPYF